MRNNARKDRMTKTLPYRFWFEAALAVLTGLLALVTPIVPDWIEFVSGWDPDRGDGSVERIIVVSCCVAALLSVSLAVRDLRRARTRPGTKVEARPG